jgi:hypothetical protein
MTFENPKLKVVVNNVKTIKLVNANEFTKQFRWDEKEIDCYVSKAFDEETKQHWIVASIPSIKELSVNHIQFPFIFETEAERDAIFDDFQCEMFLENLLSQIKQQIEDAKQAEESN